MLTDVESKLQGHVHYYKSTIHGISHLRAVSLLAGELAPPEFKKDYAKYFQDEDERSKEIIEQNKKDIKYLKEKIC